MEIEVRRGDPTDHDDLAPPLADSSRPAQRGPDLGGIVPRCVAAAAFGMLGFVAAGCAPDPPSAVVGLVVDSCDPGQETGSGMVVAPGLALTSAHVVAGADEITIEQGRRSATGTIVGFDPEMDLAYVAFDAIPTRVPEVNSDGVAPGDIGVAYVVRDQEVVAVPVKVRRRVQIRTEDIYIQGETMRPGIELDADIEGGDSGGAVMINGRVVGVIWARSNRFDDRAYAIDAVRATDLIDEQHSTGTLGPDVDITRCH